MVEKWYKGLCPVGREEMYPKEKLDFVAVKDTPHVICPIHGCRVEMVETSEEDVKLHWSLGFRYGRYGMERW